MFTCLPACHSADSIGLVGRTEAWVQLHGIHFRAERGEPWRRHGAYAEGEEELLLRARRRVLATPGTVSSNTSASTSASASASASASTVYSDSGYFFDPATEVQAKETQRSGAFDATEKPVVNGVTTASDAVAGGAGGGGGAGSNKHRASAEGRKAKLGGAATAVGRSGGGMGRAGRTGAPSVNG